MPTTRTKFLKLLAFVQNSTEHFNHDIMTFSAFMDDAELASHIIRNARALKKSRQAELLNMMRDMREASEKEAA